MFHEQTLLPGALQAFVYQFNFLHGDRGLFYSLGGRAGSGGTWVSSGYYKNESQSFTELYRRKLMKTGDLVSLSCFFEFLLVFTEATSGCVL